MIADSLQPITVYGSSISYFTGKLENYFRIKGVPYQFQPMTTRTVAPIVEGTGLRLIMEPGRVIVGNAGVLLTRVLYNKVGGDKRFVIVDAGMNDLLRPSLYGGFHRVWPVRGRPPPPLGEDAPDPPCDIVGPVCESADYLAQDRPLPPVERGDVLAVMSVGAYAFTMASNYNERRRGAEVLVEGGDYAVVRRRESYADLTRLEDPQAARRTLRTHAYTEKPEDGA